jgi:kynureninase
LTCNGRIAGYDLGTTAKYQRRLTSAAADSGLGTTFKYLVNQNTGAGSI